MDKKLTKETRHGQCQSMKITSMFKVKKCLFDSNSEFKSPQSKFDAQGSPVVSTCLFGNQSFSPDVMLGTDDSPFSQFASRKRRVEACKNDWNSSTPNRMDICTTPLKKNTILIRKLVDDSLKASSPEANPIKIAVQKSIQEPDLIGDFSKPCILPIIEGKHPDLKTISPQTVALLLQGSNSPNFTIIDCRYPYEYQGGHIKNARNIYFKGDAEAEFFENKENVDNTILLFYCEFSSERAPSMMRFLRSKDRSINKDQYPRLCHPEMYVIEGGYKAFYSNFKELCVPESYTPMLQENFSDQMTHYRMHCKSYSSRNKRRRANRSPVKL